MKTKLPEISTLTDLEIVCLIAEIDAGESLDAFSDWPNYLSDRHSCISLLQKWGKLESDNFVTVNFHLGGDWHVCLGNYKPSKSVAYFGFSSNFCRAVCDAVLRACGKAR